MKPLKKMRQFRSTDSAFQRWRAIRLPYGDQDFSTVVRAALERLYKELVADRPPEPNGWKATRFCACNTCHVQKLVDDSFRCAVCHLLALGTGKIKRASELGTTAGPAVVQTSRPTGSVVPAAPPAKKQRAKAATANGSRSAKASKGRKARKGGE